MRRQKQKHAASKGGEAHSCSLDPSAISASVIDVLHLRIDTLNAVLNLSKHKTELSKHETEHWKVHAEYWKTQKELSVSRCNHLITRLFEASGIPGLGHAKLKNGHNVAVRKTAAYPGERTPEIIHAGECFVYISTSTIMFEGAPITFYELPDRRPWFCAR